MLARFAFALLVAAGANSEAPQVQVTDYGIYYADVELAGDWKQGVPVSIASSTNIELSDASTRIPAMAGVNFGLHARIANPSHDHPIIVSCVITHPLFTTPDGQKHTEDVSDVEQVDPGKSITEEAIWYFVKECPYEFVPGEWTITIKVDGKSVTKKVFLIYKPKPQADH